MSGQANIFMNEHLKIQQSLLLVDDSLSNLAILSSALLSEYRLFTATDGLQALEIACREHPNLILLDIKMPGISGHEVCLQLKKQADTCDIPVIFVTGLDEEEDEAIGFALGAVDYIAKPIRPGIVRARVATQLRIKAERDQLALTACTDMLTGIPNRRHFEEVVQNEWNRALRYAKPLCLMMLDVDFFKQYNDHYGHAAGDGCLKAVANCAMDALRRADDMMARWGGEEFVCVLSGLTQQQAIDQAGKILSCIRELGIAHAGSAVADHVTVSLGLAMMDLNRHKTWQTLLEQADQALYRAKHQGRDRLVVA